MEQNTCEDASEIRKYFELKKKHVSVPLTLISLSAFACCSWWRAKALGLVFTTTAFVLFLQAPFFVPHLQLSQQPKSAFLHGQPCDFEVFFLLQVFLQEQVCNKSNNHYLYSNESFIVVVN